MSRYELCSLGTVHRGAVGCYGHRVGQVIDQQNAAIGGAAVELIDLDTNAVRNAVTNEAGRYDFVNIPPGKYDLTVSKSGFSQTRIGGQTVEVGLTLTLDVVLQVGDRHDDSLRP
jgi:hypothetical protein